eukprot:TRINITY_DN1606_c0_g1_i11.p1 TRINITY_DN1606_c0_g1~~TRINITY_DN1606_c0_g1_i11.p1  ORF type:complete len:533 (-),score=23.93 TRINITY_DN1606_c0_g1_i11:76-1674(-)
MPLGVAIVEVWLLFGKKWLKNWLPLEQKLPRLMPPKIVFQGIDLRLRLIRLFILCRGKKVQRYPIPRHTLVLRINQSPLRWKVGNNIKHFLGTNRLTVFLDVLTVQFQLLLLHSQLPTSIFIKNGDILSTFQCYLDCWFRSLLVLQLYVQLMQLLLGHSNFKPLLQYPNSSEQMYYGLKLQGNEYYFYFCQVLQINESLGQIQLSLIKIQLCSCFEANEKLVLGLQIRQFLKQTARSKVSEMQYSKLCESSWQAACVKGVQSLQTFSPQGSYHLELITYLCIVMEHAEGGDLHTYVNERYFRLGKRMTEDEIRWWFRGLIFAAQHIKQLDIINQDIKLENCLIQHNRDGTQTLKLCDFGFAKNLTRDSAPQSCVGSRPYIPPEVVSSHAGDRIEWHKRDIWSCGVCLYCLVYGRFPFDPDKFSSLFSFFKAVEEANVVFPGYPRISPELKDLIQKMLIADPADRIGVEEVISSEWFQSGKQVIVPKIHTSKSASQQSDEEIEFQIDKAFEQRNESIISDIVDELLEVNSEEL